MGDSDVPLSVSVDDHNMVDTDCINYAAVEVTVCCGEHDLFGAILGIEESIPQRLTPPGGGTSRCLLCIKRVIQTIPKRTPQPNQVRMSKRIHSLAPDPERKMFLPPPLHTTSNRKMD